MTLDQLRIFVAVAEQEHLTRAANALALSQSAVSSSIAALEERYDVKLFDRIGRNIALTAAGRVFLAEAQAVLARAASAQSVLADLAGLRRGALSVAASQTVASYWLPAVMHRFHTDHPGIELSLSIANTEQVVRKVDEGTVDLGFIEDQVEVGGLAVLPVAKDQLTLVVAPNHPWAAFDSVPSDADLLDSRWVLREPGSGTRGIFEKSIKSLGIDPASLNIVLELSSNEAVRSAVEAGAGATVLSRLVVESSIQLGTLKALSWPLPERDFLMLRNKQRHASEAIRAFSALASTYNEQSISSK